MVNKPPTEEDESTAIESLRDHWWVQRQQDNLWLELDPTLPDAEAGKTLSSASDTIDTDKIDTKLMHEVEVRVVIEQWADGQTTERRALSKTLRPSELYGVPIVLQHYPLQFPSAESFSDPATLAKQVTSAVLSQREWLPVLSIGENDAHEFSFTVDGDLKQPGANPVAGGFERAGSALDRAFGGQQTPPAQQDQSPNQNANTAKALTAEWLEYEFRSPGVPTRTVRREIFDLIGPAARLEGNKQPPQIEADQTLKRGLTLLGQTEILPLACRLSPEFVEHLAATNMIANKDILVSARQNTNQEPAGLAEGLNKLKPQPGLLYDLALSRGMWGRFRNDIYYDQPNLLSYHVQLQQDSKGDTVICEGFDIVANDVGVRRGTGVDPFLVRLEQGILDTNAEALLASSCGHVENAAETITAAMNQGVGLRSVRNREEPVWQEITAPKDARARIEKELSVGNIVIVPQREIPIDGKIRFSWWVVNPSDGNTLGIGERGWGQTVAENENINILTLGRAITKFVLILFCLRRAGFRAEATSIDKTTTGVCLVAGGFGVASVFPWKYGGLCSWICDAIAGLYALRNLPPHR